jgi:hypothetical protein
VLLRVLYSHELAKKKEFNVTLAESCTGGEDWVLSLAVQELRLSYCTAEVAEGDRRQQHGCTVLYSHGLVYFRQLDVLLVT